MKKILFVTLAAMSLLLASCSSDLPKGEFMQDEAKKMLALVNEFRTGAEANYIAEDNVTVLPVSRLDELVWNEKLEEVAKIRAQEIAEKFSHERPNGEMYFTAYQECEVSYFFCAENIAAGQANYEACFNAWKEDGLVYEKQGHRRNMLNRNGTSIGIACFVPEDDTMVYRKYWVMELIGSK